MFGVVRWVRGIGTLFSTSQIPNDWEVEEAGFLLWLDGKKMFVDVEDRVQCEESKYKGNRAMFGN